MRKMAKRWQNFSTSHIYNFFQRTHSHTDTPQSRADRGKFSEQWSQSIKLKRPRQFFKLLPENGVFPHFFFWRKLSNGADERGRRNIWRNVKLFENGVKCLFGLTETCVGQVRQLWRDLEKKLKILQRQLNENFANCQKMFWI